MNWIKLFRRKILLFSLLFMFVSAFVSPLFNEIAYGSEIGDIADKIDAFYKVRKDYTAGISIAYFNDKEVLKKDYGFINMEKKIPVDSGTVFEWGSVTKLLVWTSVMQLEEEGKIDLNTDIKDYIGKDFLKKGGKDVKITLLDLMNHRAGFSDTLYLPEVDDPKKIKELEDALKYYEPSMVYKVGEVTSYSNYGVSLAAYAVEKVTGKKFYDYVKENIFNPLEINKTSIKADFSDNEYVKNKRFENSSYIIMEGYNENLKEAISYIELYPSGSAIGTMDDFIKFGKGFIEGSEESKKLFKKPETLKKIFETTDFYGGTKIPKNAHGLWYLPYGEGLLGHGGNTKGYSANLFFDFKNNKGVAVFTNEAGETSYNYGILGLIFGDYKLNPELIEKNTRNNKQLSKDISGIYINSRANFTNNYGKFLKNISGIMPIKKGEKDGEFKLAVGPGKINRVEENIYIIDSENGLKSLMVLNNLGKKTVFEGYTVTSFKETLPLYILKLLSVVGYFLGAITSVIIILLTLIKYILSKGKNIKEKILYIIFHISNVLGAISVFNLVFSDSVTSMNKALPYTIVIIIFTLFLIITYILRRRAVKKIEVINTIILIISILNIVYWQWWNGISL